MIYLALLAPVLALGLLIAMSKVETWHDEVNPERARARDRLVQQGKLEISGSQVSIPKSRWLLADGIIASLM